MINKILIVKFSIKVTSLRTRYRVDKMAGICETIIIFFRTA